jgi:hypothetical protein
MKNIKENNISIKEGNICGSIDSSDPLTSLDNAPSPFVSNGLLIYSVGSNAWTNSTPNANSYYHAESEHVKVDSILEGWSFFISNKKHSASIIAVSDASSCGIQMSVRALIKKVNEGVNVAFLKDKPKWAMDPDFISSDLRNEEKEKNIEVEVFFKSCDSNYKEWFNMFEISQNGISLKINNTAHPDLFKNLHSIQEVIETIKCRIIIEAIL